MLLIRAGHDTADRLFQMLYGTKLPTSPFADHHAPETRAHVRELYVAIQAAKAKGLIRLVTLSIPGSDRGRASDNARSWWVGET